ncbi:MAG: zinc metallopeptidase [Hyphomicrobiales bacterium]
MPIFLILGLLLLAAVIFGPQFWVKRVIQKHAVHRDDLQGTGGELAHHLIEHFELNSVGVEMTDQGDHYDPATRTVRLSDQNFNGKSLSAVAIAAHEVGHAIQHMNGERLLALRQSMAKFVMWTDRIAVVFFSLAPLLGVISRAPAIFILLAVMGFLFIGARVAVQLITLPVEFDASFKKALPILEQGGYLKSEDMPAARSVLKAAAMTYVAAALMSLIDVIRFARFGR